MKRYCLALDLVNDPAMISQYIEHHKAVWPEITDSIKKSGIIDMQIFNVADRLFMVIEVEEGFSFEKKFKVVRNDAEYYEERQPESEQGWSAPKNRKLQWPTKYQVEDHTKPSRFTKSLRDKFAR